MSGSIAERSVDGRGQVGRAIGPAGRVRAHLVRLADQLAAADAGAGEDGREDGRPVVAAVLAVDVAGALADPGRAAELAGHDHQRLVEQAPGRQVVEQRRDAPVGRRQQPVLERLEVGRVRVPGLDPAHVHLDDRHAHLDQPAGQQQRLAVHVPAVAVAEPRVFLAQVEGPRDPAREQQRVGPVDLVGERVLRTRRPAGRPGRRRALRRSSSDFRRSSRSMRQPLAGASGRRSRTRAGWDPA